MGATNPRDALDARLQLLPSPDDQEFQPTTFFRRLIEGKPIGDEMLNREALFADHQRAQNLLSDALQYFHWHRSCHSLEFCATLSTLGHKHARPYLADVAHWNAELRRLVLPETSAVERSPLVRRL